MCIGSFDGVRWLVSVGERREKQRLPNAIRYGSLSCKYLSPCAAGWEKRKVVDVFKLRKMAISSRQRREMAQICQMEKSRW